MMQGQGRVHPSEPDFSGEMSQSVSATSASDPSSSSLCSFHLEKPGAHVLQVPKDKVFRVPPPENARLFEHYTRRATRRRRRRRCSCVRVCTWTLATVLALAAVGGAAYLALGPRRPAYAVRALAASGLGEVGDASAPGAFSPAFEATVRADNPNGRVGVHYDGDGSHVSVSYDGVLLAEGAWPAAFYQEPRNVTVFVARAEGAGLRLSPSVRGRMAAAERLRSVPFDVDIEVPVRLQLGKLKTWTVPVRARCTVAVDRLDADAKVVLSESCSVKLRLLFWWS